jgi:Tfp pilus assembly protein PilX
MNEERKLEKKRPEAGAALLIAIFALLLISVVAIALVVSQGTDSALTGNYRTSTSAYYAGLAGLEEGRGRLLMKNADYLNKTGSFPSLFTAAGAPTFGLKNALYILNPAAGETVNPTGGSAAQYADTEYDTEYADRGSGGWTLSGATVYSTNSVFPVAGLPGPLYKWVRITPATEQSIGVDVNWDHGIDNATPLSYDPANQSSTGALQPGLIVQTTPPATAGQALEVTALAVLPNNTQKLVQYVVAPFLYGVKNPIPAALVIPGSGVTDDPGISFKASSSASFQISGNDGTGPYATPPAGCTASAPRVWAIGTSDTATTQGNAVSNYYRIVGAVHDIPVTDQANYLGGSPPSPPVIQPTPPVIPPYPPVSLREIDLPTDGLLSPAMQSPRRLNALVRSISQNADVVLTPSSPGLPVTDSNMPATMSIANPLTVVVNGDLTLTNFTGYGLLVVTGNFIVNLNAGWRGVVLVIGAGNVTFTGGPGGGSGEFDGGMFIANTLPATDPDFGTATFDASSAGGRGIYYNSCWVNAALQPPSFTVLSFREIPTN